MSLLFPDTQSEAEKVLLDLIRKAPTWRKVEMLGQLHRVTRDLMLGPDLAARAYGPMTEE